MTADGPQAGSDPYSRVDYRRLIAWDDRIRREAPFLERCLAEAPERSVLDLGCGTGEHVAWFASLGARAVGIDASEAMIAKAREHEQRGLGSFVSGDLLDASAALPDGARFGLAVCLGNVLPHLRSDEEIARFLRSLAAVLLPGGVAVIQLLDYARILAKNERWLPLNIREGESGGEVVFLRLMKPAGGGAMLFFPTTLALDPDAPEPVRVVQSRRVELHAWTADDLAPRFAAAGFDLRLCGDMRGNPYVPASSSDLVLVARRPPA